MSFPQFTSVERAVTNLTVSQGPRATLLPQARKVFQIWLSRLTRSVTITTRGLATIECSARALASQTMVSDLPLPRCARHAVGAGALVVQVGHPLDGALDGEILLGAGDFFLPIITDD